MKNALIFVGVGAVTLLALRYGRSAFTIASNARYSGTIVNFTGQARQATGDIKSITGDAKGIIDNIKGFFDTKDDADQPRGIGSMFESFSNDQMEA